MLTANVKNSTLSDVGRQVKSAFAPLLIEDRLSAAMNSSTCRSTRI